MECQGHLLFIGRKGRVSEWQKLYHRKVLGGVILYQISKKEGSRPLMQHFICKILYLCTFFLTLRNIFQLKILLLLNQHKNNWT